MEQKIGSRITFDLGSNSVVAILTLATEGYTEAIGTLSPGLASEFMDHLIEGSCWKVVPTVLWNYSWEVVD